MATQAETMAWLLASLRTASNLYRQAHWQSTGPEFYGLHLLFQRLYEETDQLYDGIAERAVGLGFDISEYDQVDLITEDTDEIVGSNETWLEVAADAAARAEAFLKRVYDWPVSHGLDDLLAATASKIQEHRYLLRQSMTPASEVRGIKRRLLKP